jgi:hypothetical protein
LKIITLGTDPEITYALDPSGATSNCVATKSPAPRRKDVRELLTGGVQPVGAELTSIRSMPGESTATT